MLRETLNKIFSSRVFYVLFSLIVSISLWMFVELNENRELRITIQNVPIVFRNMDLLNDRGLLITDVNPQTITLWYDVPRALSTSLNSGNVSVEVDLAGINQPGYRSLRYDVIIPAGINRNALSGESKSVEHITLLIDRLLTRPVPVRVFYSGGTSAENLVAENPEATPQTINVSGPEYVISRINYARVDVEREALSSTFSENLRFVFIDEDGEELDAGLRDLVTPIPEEIRVVIPVREIKNIPLSVELMHGAGTTRENVRVTPDPPFITVKGDPDALRDFNHITLGTIPMTEFGISRTYPFNIVIPNYIENVSGETQAQVFVEVLGLDIEIYSVSNLHVINMPPGFREEWVTQTLDIRIRGRREDLDLVSRGNIRVVADLRDVQPVAGRVVQLTAVIYIDGVDADVGAVGEYRVAIRFVLDHPEETG